MVAVTVLGFLPRRGIPVPVTKRVGCAGFTDATVPVRLGTLQETFMGLVRRLTALGARYHPKTGFAPPPPRGFSRKRAAVVPMGLVLETKSLDGPKPGESQEKKAWGNNIKRRTDGP
jgi:hypothetical protein